jgi:phage terminase Nu1 subunit (DNA packaging protein)
MNAVQKSRSRAATRQKGRRFKGLTQADCASVLGMAMRHFQRLQAAGVFSKPEGNAGYDLRTVVAEWTKYVEQGRSPTDAAKARLMEIMADVRLKNAKADAVEGELLDRDGTREIVTAMAVRLAAALDGVAGRVAGEVVAAIGGERAVVREVLFREHRKIRAQMVEALGDLIEEGSTRAA